VDTRREGRALSARDVEQLTVQIGVAIEAALGDLAATGVQVGDGVRLVLGRAESGENGLHTRQRKRFATRRQVVPIVRSRLKSRLSRAPGRNLAKPAGRTTLSLELFAEFSRCGSEREPPVDAFLDEVLLRRPDIALRDHDKAALFQGETTPIRGARPFSLIAG